MLSRRLFILFLLTFGITLNTKAQNIVINEICASNYQCFEDDDGGYGDWIELYNAGNSSVNLAGMYLTDDFGNLTKLPIPSTSSSSTTVGARSHIVFWFDEDMHKGETHLNSKLNGSGEQLALVAADGVTIIDSVTFGKQIYDVTYGRTTDGSSSWSYFPEPTPDDDNDGGGYTGIMDKVQFNLDGGFYNSPVQVELTYPQDPSAVIYYTLNGNEPSPGRGRVYSGPIQVDTIAVIRARAFKPNHLGGEIATKSFFINRPIDLPVLSIVTDSSNLWDIDDGIYCFGRDDYDHSYSYSGANFHEDWKKPGHIEFFESTGAELASQNLEISISGNTSRAYAQKSMNFEAHNALGKSSIPCQLFPELPVADFKAFKIRNGGSDWSSTGIRDVVNQRLCTGAMDIETQSYRQVIVYLNGQYWGISNLSEKIDTDYLNSRFPAIDKDSIDLIYNNAKVIKGDNTGYNNLISFIDNNSLSVPANYNYVASQIDILNYINYTISRIYYATTDWPSNNIKYWRPQDLSMKWRWIQWDTDRSTSLTTDPSRACDYNDNTVKWATRSSSVPSWAKLLLNGLLENDDFKRSFVTQFAHHMNFTYCINRVDSVLNYYRNVLQTELPRHISRWEHTNDTIDYYTAGYYHSVAEWNTEVDTIRRFFLLRPRYVRGDIMDELGISDTFHISISKVPVQGGTVLIDTFSVPDNHCDLVYFEDCPVTLRAIAAPGYQFSGWSTATGDTLPVTWSPDGDTNVTAYFTPYNPIAAEPTLSSSGLSKFISNCTQLNLNWTPGNGSSRLVVLKAGSAVDHFPTDSNSFAASPVFGNGTDLGNGNFVVYSGNGNSCLLTGLVPGTTYHCAIIEFNGNNSTANYLVNTLLSDSITITAFAVNVSSSANSICAGSQVTLSASGGGTQFQWSPANGLSSASDSVVIASPDSSIEYTVIVNDANGCADTGIVSILVNFNPIVNLGSIPDICASNGLFALSVGSPSGGSYSGPGVTNNLFDPAITGTGIHSIIYTYTDSNSCSGADTSSITVLPSPSVSLPADTSLCESDSLILDAGSGFAAYAWSTGATTQSIVADTNAAGNTSETYWITVTDNSGCTATDSMEVTFDLCTKIHPIHSLQEVSAYPNPFSDQLTIITKHPGANVRLFDITGNLIVEYVMQQAEISIKPEIANGLYFLLIEQDFRIATFKITKI